MRLPLCSRKRVESRCGAVALGRTYLLPPLSSGGASVVQPWLRFHIPLIEPGHADFPHPALGQELTLSRATPSAVSDHLSELIGCPISRVLPHVLRLS